MIRNANGILKGIRKEHSSILQMAFVKSGLRISIEVDGQRGVENKGIKLCLARMAEQGVRFGTCPFIRTLVHSIYGRSIAGVGKPCGTC